ncbi:PREDICTED: protein TIC 21, chloroplastic-like [Tarenaya hassleriana]|uniref:protein TIC 21, chloroplastic-like n=1 Tax=Tarenaya hassleriana TaxID=28532 RepID=UPI00053C37C8|nr:PREDICTED: protein TIC 21, chloroplastic-like [Tarenaya hassleriana]
MRSLLTPAASSGISTALRRERLFARLTFSSNPLSPLRSRAAASSFLPFPPLLFRQLKPNFAAASSSASFAADTELDKAKIAQVAKRLEKTSKHFKSLGSFGFWGQLVLTVVASVILSFSVVVTGKPTSPATFYATAGGIAAAFVSVFWSFGYIRLSERLRRTSADPSKAPPRADAVRGLKNGIMVNLLGMGGAILGMQATVGFLVAKALTTSANPFYQGVSPGYSPVLALDIFLVQASANTILSHFLGLVCSLELLRSVTLSSSEPVFVT